MMKTECHGTYTAGSTTVIKVRVLSGDGAYLDGAWGQYGEIVAWLESRGYPEMVVDLSSTTSDHSRSRQ